jgi:hypothetical protein
MLSLKHALLHRSLASNSVLALESTMAAYISEYGLLLWPILLAVIYSSYRAALPKPLTDIPYNHDAAGKLLGDVPEMVAYVKRTKRVFVSALMNLGSSKGTSTVTTMLNSPS